MAVLLGGPVVFVCPNCTSELVLDEVPGKPVLHPCRGLVGLMAPMVRQGVNCKVEAVERDDYEGRDLAHRDGEGRVVMAIETTRDDGTDRIVLVPTAVVSRDEYLAFKESR